MAEPPAAESPAASDRLRHRNSRSRNLSETLVIVVVDLRADRPRICKHPHRSSFGCGRGPADRVRLHAGDPAAPVRNARHRRSPRRFAVADLGGLLHPICCRVGRRAHHDRAPLRTRQPCRHRRRRLRRLFQRRADRHPLDAGGAWRRGHRVPHHHRRRPSADHDAGQRLPERVDEREGGSRRGSAVATRGATAARGFAGEASDPHRSLRRASLARDRARDPAGRRGGYRTAGQLGRAARALRYRNGACELRYRPADTAGDRPLGAEARGASRAGVRCGASASACRRSGSRR